MRYSFIKRMYLCISIAKYTVIIITKKYFMYKFSPNKVHCNYNY